MICQKRRQHPELPNSSSSNSSNNTTRRAAATNEWLGRGQHQGPLRHGLPLLLLLLFTYLATTARAQGLDGFDHAVADTTDGETTQVDPRAVLLAVFEQTGGFGWNHLSGWLSEDVCSYHGVSCYEDGEEERLGHVRELRLAGNHLVGTLPSVVWTLPYLASVVVNQNPQLTVDLSDGEALRQAQFLERLELDGTATSLGNNMNGLPAVASSLRVLSMARLTNVPSSSSSVFPAQALFALHELESLDLSGNGLVGSSLSLLGANQWTKLVQLHLNDNHLTGGLPLALSNLVNLQSLQLANNAFSGVLPNLDNLVELRVLDVSREDDGNDAAPRITGPLPSLAHMRYLTRVDLSHQGLTGSLPPDFLAEAPADQLVTVRLQGNRLSGPLSLTGPWVHKAQLDLYLADNLFSGPLQDPNGLCQDNSASPLTGWLSGTVVGTTNCQGLTCPVQTYSSSEGRATANSPCLPCPTATYLGASFCATTSTTGAVDAGHVLYEVYHALGGPGWKDAAGWSVFNTLDNGNQMDAASYCSWRGVTCNDQNQITDLSLSGNGLTGIVPTQILFSLPHLVTLDLSHNAVSLSLEGIGQAATTLEALDLSQTLLDTWLGLDELQQGSAAVLKVLRLASCQLAGSLPDWLLALPALQLLDVSHNALTGSLPSPIASTTLQELWVAGNGLTGDLPRWPADGGCALTQFQAADNQLSGDLSVFDDCAATLQHLNVRHNQLTGMLPSWRNLAALVSVNVQGNQLSGNLPVDFLANGNAYISRRLQVNAADNQLTGVVPVSAWSLRFLNLVLDVTGNALTGLDRNDCTTAVAEWMDGTVAALGCPAVACPARTYNALGRQASAEDICQPCQDNDNVIGKKTCASVPPPPPPSSSNGGSSNSNNNDLQAAAAEFTVLTQLYHDTHGEHWKRSDGWTVSTNVCTWFGITCTETTHQVQSIALPLNNLSGGPPPYAQLFHALPALAELDLSDNPHLEHDGSNPLLFEGVERAQNLLFVDLSNTALTAIPGLGKASSLLEVRLDHNALEPQDMWSELLQLSTLRRLSVNGNRPGSNAPSNSLPLNLAQAFSMLQELYLIDSGLTGRLPGDLGQLSRLTYLGLSGNQFEGSAEVLNDLHQVETIALARHPDATGLGLTGPLPALDELPNLAQVYLSHQSFSGPIPPHFLQGIVNVNQPLVVELQGNRLTGGLPPALARLTSVELDATQNALTEPVPAGLCRQAAWMRSQVAEWGCRALLCPPGTANAAGRQSSAATACAPCPAAQTTAYYGSTKCLSLQDEREEAARSVLGELYQATHGDEWVNADQWLQDDVSVCDWFGVTCNPDGSVASLQLVHNGLYDTVPASLFSLTTLQELDLSWNDGLQITFDASFAGATQLQSLNLDGTGLASVAALAPNAPSSLQRVSLQHNALTSFPTQVLQIPNLQALDLSYNDLSAGNGLPASLPSQLVELTCAECHLTGPLFGSTLANLNALEHLDLSHNFLSGAIPATSLNAMANLQYLDLSHQGDGTDNNPGLTGNLPALAFAPNLRVVQLDRNALSGVVPANFMAAVSITDATDQVKVNLSFNQLSGVLPDSLNRLGPTAQFYAAGNQLTGFASSSLCSLDWNDGRTGASGCNHIVCPANTYNGLGRATSTVPCRACNDGGNLIGRTFCVAGEREILVTLFNTLGGKLWKHDDGWSTGAEDVCSWYGVTCHGGTLRPGTIQKLELRDNDLQGTLTDDIWSLTELMELDLSENSDLIVPSFAAIGNAASLHSLELSQTVVQSMAGIGQAQALKTLSCTNCQIKGALKDVEIWGNLLVLERLVLNYNQLTGPLVGSSVRQLSRLQELSLVHNQLNGTLPVQLANLAYLEILTLGHNLFSGQLPTGLSFLPKLRVLAVDHEKPEVEPLFGVVDTGLTGTLPSFRNAPNLRELYLGYNHIGGAIPPNFLNGVSDKNDEIIVDLTSNDLHQQVPATLNQFENLQLYVAANRIDGIDQALCRQGANNWMDGLLGADDSCDALLCPPGFYNEWGRQTAAEECRVCDHRGMALYYGSTKCLAIFPEFRSDRDMLQEFYEQAGGDQWTQATNWNNQDASICTWHGVSCDTSVQGEERVAEIVLPSNNLQGPLASIVFYLPRLRKLDVSGNSLLQVSFRDAGDATNLQELNVQDTLLTSLEGLDKAVNLQTLQLSDNALLDATGFPTQLYSLSKLRVLEMARAGVAGQLSEVGMFAWQQMETLVLSDNALDGEIPDVFGETLQNLKVLDLSDNSFYGRIPKTLSTRATALRSLDLSARRRPRSGLSGPVPSFANNPDLIALDLGANALTGTVPSDLLAGVAAAEPVTVSLDGNLLHGAVPAALQRFSSLYLDLVDNEIDSIPPSLCLAQKQWMGGDVGSFGCNGMLCPAGFYNAYGRQTSKSSPCKECPGDDSLALGKTFCPSIAKAETKQILQSLYEQTGGDDWHQSEGWFTNPDICQWYGIDCNVEQTLVETINLGSNNLVGTPPPELFEVAGLQNLWLFSNPISLSFDNVASAKSLQNLQLDSTRLSSLQGLGQAPALTYLDVRFNQLQGLLPADELEPLQNLEVLLVSNNALTGPLPQFLGPLRRSLRIFRAASNKFTGSLPTFDVHPHIQTIDVAHNQLSGGIPPTFLQQADTTHAVLVDVSDNALTGVLPASLARFVDLTLYARDNQISGVAPELCLEAEWNAGSVGIYQCDALLCPPQTFSTAGRASPAVGDCEPCPYAPYFGHSTCDSTASIRSAGRATGTVFGVLLIVLFTGLSMSLL